MKFLEEIAWQVVILGAIAPAISFLVWKLKGGKMTFGTFLSKYGELLAYAGILIIALIVAVFQFMLAS